MKVDPQTVFLYSLIPAAVGLLGGFVPTLITFRSSILTYFQHFVAGIVLAAATTTVLPEALKSSSLSSLCIGFISGVVVLLIIHAIAHFLERFRAKSFPLGGVFASMLDLFIDGFLIGIAFVVGRETGFLVTFSLSFCAFFLCLTVGGMISGFFSRMFSSFIMAVMLPLGTFVAMLIVPHIFSSLYYEIIAFGLAGLLYLACEEMLKSAHKREDNAFSSSLFFAGFLLIVVLTTQQ